MAYGSEIRFYKMPAVNIYRMNFSIWAKRIKGRRTAWINELSVTSFWQHRVP